jgi:pimeloyl-ACP methyl ester carboxylesterase
MQEHRLSIAGQELVAYEYNAEKDTIPLIFIHGITGNVGFWEGAKIPLMDTVHWFSLSLPAHYPASFPANFSLQDMTAEMIAEVMSAAITQLTGSKPAILVGHSTGGFAVLAVAHQSPELVHSIVLVDGFALGKWYGTFAPAQFIAQFGEKAFWLYFKSFSFAAFPFRIAYIMLSSNWISLWKSPSFKIIANASFPYTQKLNLRSMWLYFNRMPKIDIRAWLPKIQQHVSIIHGKRDWIIPPAHAEEMQKLLSNNDICWIDNSGHIPMFENTAAYEAALSTALEGAMLETRARA